MLTTTPVTHDDFVREYAASIDRMMATKGASRLDLAENFVPAWGLLTKMKPASRDYADVTVGQLTMTVRAADLKTLDELASKRAAQGTMYGAQTEAVSWTITKEEYQMAQQYGADVVGVLPLVPKAVRRGGATT